MRAGRSGSPVTDLLSLESRAGEVPQAVAGLKTAVAQINGW
jgi:hypothetical protein